MYAIITLTLIASWASSKAIRDYKGRKK